jgi:GntR family transcriptional regulator, rspAB operon transcriptional repressor
MNTRTTRRPKLISDLSVSPPCKQVIEKSKSSRTAGTSSRLKAGGKSLSDQAYQQIRNEILSGDLSMGAILSRRRLAERLNMSFLPVTEALGRLETERLVESRPRIGTRVRIPSEQDIRDSSVIREALESQAARLCAQQITDKEKKQLRANATHLDELHMRCATESQDSRFMHSVHAYHMQFHMSIADLARYPGLHHAIENEQVLIFNWLYDVAADRRTYPRKFHLTLAEALCSGDPLVADAAMRAHVQYGLAQVLERLAKHDSSRDGWRLKNRKSAPALFPA